MRATLYMLTIATFVAVLARRDVKTTLVCLILLTLASCVGCEPAPKSRPAPTKATESGAAKVEELTR